MTSPASRDYYLMHQYLRKPIAVAQTIISSSKVSRLFFALTWLVLSIFSRFRQMDLDLPRYLVSHLENSKSSSNQLPNATLEKARSHSPLSLFAHSMSQPPERTQQEPSVRLLLNLRSVQSADLVPTAAPHACDWMFLAATSLLVRNATSPSEPISIASRAVRRDWSLTCAGATVGWSRGPCRLLHGPPFHHSPLANHHVRKLFPGSVVQPTSAHLCRHRSNLTLVPFPARQPGSCSS